MADTPTQFPGLALKAAFYDWMYRTWAPWDSVGVRQDLIELLRSGHVTPDRFPRTIDLGCGTGANVVYLASIGFDSVGVDFSGVAIRKARRRAIAAGVDARFVLGDLTAEKIDGLEGPFDFLVDFGTLDDLTGDARRAMAETITRLSRPGSKFLEYCFYGSRDDLPWVSMTASKFSHIAPGELDGLFGEDWRSEQFARYDKWRTAAFLLTRR